MVRGFPAPCCQRHPLTGEAKDYLWKSQLSSFWVMQNIASQSRDSGEGPGEPTALESRKGKQSSDFPCGSLDLAGLKMTRTDASFSSPHFFKGYPCRTGGGV